METPKCKCHGVEMVTYHNVRHENGSKSKKLYWRCRVKYNEYQRKHRSLKSKHYNDLSRKYRLKRYGITESEYITMFNKQGGVCAICGSKPDTRWKMLAVDHDHKTGKVRGLLCMVCNTMLGRLEERWERISEYIGVNL